MSPIPTSILLLGAGELGTAILTHLSAHPLLLSKTHFTVALRPQTVSDPSSSRLSSLRSQVPPGTHLSFAGLDLTAPDARDSLLRIIRESNAEVVISCTGFATGSGGSDSNGAQKTQAQLLIADAVFEAGKAGVVKRYFPWQFGGNYDVIGAEAAGGFMREHCAVRALLRERSAAAGVEWTIVSAGLFMSFVFEEWFGVVEGLGEGLKSGERGKVGEKVTVRGLGGWDTRVTLTDVQDIGKVVADLVARPLGEGEGARNDKGGSVVFISGQTVTCKELADVVERVLGEETRVEREELTLEYLREELEKEPGDKLRNYRVLFGAGEGISWDEEETINVKRGIETVGVERWLREKLGM